MINIIGLLILVVGFFLPHLSEMRVPFIPFFWVGGLLILDKGIIIKDKLKWHKWAQISILIHIAIVVMSLLAYFLIGYGSITRFEYWLEMVFYWISSPATAIGQQIFPYPETHHPGGAVSFQVSHFRTVITVFLNVAIFAISFTLIGIFWEKGKREKRNSEHANQPDWQ